MPTPLVEWKEVGTWAAAVKGAARPVAVPPVLWSLPGLLLVAVVVGYLYESWAIVVLAVLLLGGSLGLLYRIGNARKRTEEFRAASALADAWTASGPMRLVWDNLPGALHALGWYRDTMETVKTRELDTKTGEVVEKEHDEPRREHPHIRLTSEDPAGEVVLIVATTSGLVPVSNVESRGPDLAGYLGLVGWCVEAAPSSEVGHLVIRLARFARGGDVNRRVRVEV